MPLFILAAIDMPDSLELRAATRSEHLAFAENNPMVRLGGPFLDDAGSPIGSMFILEAEDREAAVAFAAADPYAKAGLFESTTIRAWRKVLGDLS